MPKTKAQRRFGCAMKSNPAARKSRGLSQQVAEDLCHGNKGAKLPERAPKRKRK